MDRIFAEIKKAIEEEMRNAESGPSPGGGRRPSGSGQRAQDYAEWLKEEQERLRGGEQPAREQPPADPPPPQVEAITSVENWEAAERERREEARRRDQELRERREASLSETRQEEAHGSRQPERRRQRRQRTSTVAPPARGAGLSHGVRRLLNSPQGMRQAFLLREIVSKPVSLRDADEHLIS